MRFGPTFLSELRAAGIDDPRAAITEDGLVFKDDVPYSFRNRVMAVVMAHNPDAPLFVEPDPVDVLRNALLKAGVLTTEQIDVAKEETPVAIVVAAVDSK
jgi:hypothetical protein